MNEMTYLAQIAMLTPAQRRLLIRHLDMRAPVSATSTSEVRLVAYVVPEPGATLDVMTLRTALGAQLPAYMVPTSMMLLDELPLTPNGKLDRALLPDPDAARVDLPNGFAAPSNDIEHQIADIWCMLLGLDEASTTDDFFELGGHSLLVARVIAGIREACGVDVPVATFFQGPTIAALAAYVARVRWAAGGDTGDTDEHDEFEL